MRRIKAHAYLQRLASGLLFAALASGGVFFLGSVVGRDAGGPDRLAAGLSTYVLSHREDPILSLEGADTDNLRKAEAALEMSEARYLAGLGPRDRNLLEGAIAPHALLTSLPDLEDARRRLLADPSAENARDYHRLLVGTLRAYDSGVMAFARALGAARAQDVQIGFVGGTSDPETYRESAMLLRSAARTLLREEESRFSCVRGASRLCETSERSSSVEAGEEEQVDTAVPEHVVQAKDFYLATGIYGDQVYADASLIGGTDEIVILSRAKCVAGSPAYFLSMDLRDAETGVIARKVLPLENLTFLDTEAARATTGYGRYLSALAEAGARWYFQPINPYLCPDLSFDIARASSVLDLSMDARLQPLGELSPDIAAAEAAIQASAHPHETLVARYVAALLESLEEREGRTHAAYPGQGRIEEARRRVRTWQGQTGSFDKLLGDAYILNTSLAFFVRFGLGGEALLMSRSYPPLVFLAFNSTFASEPPSFFRERGGGYEGISLLRSYFGDLEREYTLPEMLGQTRLQVDLSRAMVSAAAASEGTGDVVR